MFYEDSVQYKTIPEYKLVKFTVRSLGGVAAHAVLAVGASAAAAARRGTRAARAQGERVHRALHDAEGMLTLFFDVTRTTVSKRTQTTSCEYTRR